MIGLPDLEDENLQLRAELAELKDAIVRANDPDGCACINDLPGDNYTCTAHQTLWRVAQKARESTTVTFVRQQ